MPAPQAPVGLTASPEQHRCHKARSGPGRAVLLHSKTKGTEKLGNYRIPPHPPLREARSRAAPRRTPRTGRPAGLRSAAPTYRPAPRPLPRAQVREAAGAEGRRRSPGAAAGPRPWACGTGRDGTGGEGRGQRAAAGSCGAPWWAPSAAPTSASG